MKRQSVTSGYEFEDSYGYSRAVRVGSTIFVSGTTARDDALKGNAYLQAQDVVAIIHETLTSLGAGLDDVVRTVTYVRSLNDEGMIAKAHREAFGRARPASTLIEVSRLTPESALVEIEVTAIVES